MRLGWVVGNAGIWGTLIIILIAHVISITTGLSVSAIATDKKVGAGGVYYVLSRSLGLPIGGAIGITLFVGTALSIALYLVGFAESFNAYFGYEMDINDIRITGTVALMALMAIALISTSVALKTQFFIMAAIALSLVSIFLGSTEQVPQSFNSFGVEDGASMEEIFAIFFPAVTGFTVGIAMSGDLKNSKKSIPYGTILSIVVGLIIYVVLAIFIGLSIDPEVLNSNNNILMEIAIYAPAVAAGIWGATLSSALGGILGGPRILQAMSIDKITPKIFAKGRGKDKEPWNALIITVVIAQCGILIGELDLIARVVSMFYLAAYGFINISYFLESWASSDFHPTFRIKKWISLLGFFATFAVMFKLDMIAMLAAFVFIGGIYLWLQKKQVALGTGDIWHSVWNTVVRKGLKNLEAKEDHLRNWKPNILLFSGGTNQRPHLLEMSRALAGKGGMITNFDLVENEKATVLFPKHKQSVKDELLDKYGIFGRKVEVQNVFKGIENIASTFGFSGIEPNTILMGWAKNTNDPIWFAQMTQRLIDLDYNVLYLDYDERFGFGQYKQIDIWWRDMADNIDLTLNVAKFLLTSDDWRQARVRVILVNNTMQEGFERRIHAKLDEYRIPGSVKVFHNAIERKEYYDIMKSTSVGTDLILAGIPDVPHESVKNFVQTTNNLFSVVGTCLLIKSSSKLGNEIVGQENIAGSIKAPKLIVNEHSVNVLLPADEILASEVLSVKGRLYAISESVVNSELASIRNSFSVQLADAKKSILDKLDVLIANKASLQEIKDAQVDLLKYFNLRLKAFSSNDLVYLSERIDELFQNYLEQVNLLVESSPEKLVRKLNKVDLTIRGTDSRLEKAAKRRKLTATYFGINLKVKIPVRSILSYQISTSGLANLFSFQHKLGVATYTIQDEIRSNFIQSISLFDDITTSADKVKFSIEEKFKLVEKFIDQQRDYLYTYLIQSANHLCNHLSAEIELISAAERGRQMNGQVINKDKISKEILGYYRYWLVNQNCVTDQASLDMSMHEVTYSIKSIADGLKAELNSSMFDFAIRAVKIAKQQLQEIGLLMTKGKFSEAAEFNLQISDQLSYNDLVLNSAMSELQQLVYKLPKNIKAFDSESKNSFGTFQREQIELFTIDIAHIADYLIDQQLQLPIEHELQVIPQSCRTILNQAMHSMRLVSFSLTAQHDDATKQIVLNDVFSKAVNGVDKVLEDLLVLKKNSLDKLDEIFLTAISNLNATYIIEQADELESASKRGASVGEFKVWWRGLKEKVRLKWMKLSGRLIAKRDDLSYAEFRLENRLYQNPHEQLRNFVEKATPTESVLQNLPFYYQQLFTGKHAPKIEFLQNRGRELDEAKFGLDRIRNGANGGLLIIGDPLSGKTFFSEILARENGQARVIKIEAPITGSTRTKDLIYVLQKQIGSKNFTEEVILDAPKGSIFVFDDVELWWERSERDNSVIKLITTLIQDYSNDYIFIVNVNLYAYKLMQMQCNFANYFIATIRLSPFSSRLLGETIFSRHKAGGLEYALNGVPEIELTERKSKKLMEQYYQLSKGNIGVALHQWQANITNVENNLLQIQYPVVYEMPEIKEQEWLVLLAQFILHKHLTLSRIKRIFNHESKEQSFFLLQNLMRSGLIEQVMGSTYRIPPYLVGFVIVSLKEEHLI